MRSTDRLRQLRRQALGSTLRGLRLDREMTQETVALAAGMDRSFYVELENAVHSVTVERLAEVADALGVPLSELFTDQAFQTPAP